MAKKIMTKELQEKFRGFLPLVGSAEYDYEPTSMLKYKKEDPEFVPVFKLRQWNQEEATPIKRKLSDAYEDALAEVKYDAAVVKALKDGYKLPPKPKLKSKDSDEIDWVRDNIVGWSHYYDLSLPPKEDETVEDWAARAEIKFSKDRIDLISNLIITDIFNELLKSSGLMNKNLL